MEWTLKNIVVIVIITLVALVLIISLVGPKVGLLNVAAKLGLKMGDWFLPKKPSEELKPITEEDISGDITDSYNNVVNALRTAVDSDKTNCLIKFKAFPDDFKGNKISVRFIDDTKEYRLAIEKQDVLLNSVTIENGDPLCIATKEEEGGRKIDYTGIKIKENEFKSVKILGENSNLLYKTKIGDEEVTCFLENCEKDCIDDLILNLGKTFCDEESILKDIIYQNTYYGNIEDWSKGGNRRYYKLGESMEDSKVAYTFNVRGLSYDEFRKVFDITEKIEHQSEKKNSILYNGIYYGLEKNWCYEKIEGTWRTLWFDEEKWKCYNECEEININEIDLDLKDELFGPPDYSPKCEEVE